MQKLIKDMQKLPRSKNPVERAAFGRSCDALTLLDGFFFNHRSAQYCTNVEAAARGDIVAGSHDVLQQTQFGMS